MATKTIVRYRPPNELVGRREILVVSAEAVGIFTQERDLHWDLEHNFWLDAEEAGISPELLAVLEGPEFSNEDLGHFTVETQEVSDKKAPRASAAATKKEGE